MIKGVTVMASGERKNKALSNLWWLYKGLYTIGWNVSPSPYNLWRRPIIRFERDECVLDWI